MTKHAQVSVSGYEIPLIGIPPSATEYECDCCHAKFPNQPDKLELDAYGNQFLCEKCRKNETGMSKAKQQTEQARAHLTLVIGEVSDGEHTRCCKCGEKTMLVVAPIYWGVDREPFKAGEADESVLEVEVHDEISAHYCPACCRITSFSFNEC